MFHKHKKLKNFADRNGKFGDLRTKHLSGGVKPLQPTVGTGLRTWCVVQLAGEKENEFMIFFQNKALDSLTLGLH